MSDQIFRTPPFILISLHLFQNRSDSNHAFSIFDSVFRKTAAVKIIRKPWERLEMNLSIVLSGYLLTSSPASC